MNEDRRRSIWNVVALIATLGLAAVVAVVAVTRSDRSGTEGVASPSSSPSPTPSPTAPGALAGKGPYIVYASESGEVFAYDVSAAQWVSMGRIDDAPVSQLGRQPGSGDVVALATDAGTAWRIDREGLERVAILPVSDPLRLEGGVVSRDGRRFAISTVGADPELLLVNLGNGRTSAFPRESGSANRYPPEPLVPVAWSLGGSLVYQVPRCDCNDGSPGLYLYDLETERSSLVTGTSPDTFYDRFALSPDGQELVWGDADSEPCEDDPDSTCQAPPYTLRRLAAGGRSSSIIRRETDLPFDEVNWSPDGASLLLRRVDPETRASSYEFADPESGDPIRVVAGIPDGAAVLATLPQRMVVAYVVNGATPPSLQVVANGRAVMVAEADQRPVFLGWLR